MIRNALMLFCVATLVAGCSCGGTTGSGDDAGTAGGGGGSGGGTGGGGGDGGGGGGGGGGTTLPDGGTCPSTLQTCGGSACIDIQTDEAHCGSCTTVCSAQQACVAGACKSPTASVLLSELHSAGTHFVELFNGTTSTVNVQGYQLRFVGVDGGSAAITLPAYSLPSGSFAVIDERAGANDGGSIFVNQPIPAASDVGVTLLNNSGVPIDFVRTGASTASSGATGWSGNNAPNPDEALNQSLSRKVFSPDSDTANDWFLQSPGSPADFCGRPGRCGDVCVDLENDRTNCGACGNGCASGQICLSGACAAPQARAWITEYRRSGRPAVEIHNPTATALELQNYRLEVTVGTTGNLVFFLPQRTLQPGAFLTIYQGTGTDDATAVFAGASSAFQANVTVQLFDAANAPLDFVRFGTSTTVVPTGTQWFGNNVAAPSAFTDEAARRNVQSLDTDSAADWLVGMPSTLSFACYPGLNLCSGDCFAHAVNSENCGACGVSCTAQQTCLNGACRSIGQLVISELNNTAPERIELFNGTAQSIDLSSYRVEWIADQGSNTFDLPSGTTLASGSYLVLAEGTGTNTPSELYMNKDIAWGTFIAVMLKDASGTGVDFVRTASSPSPAPNGTSWSGDNAPNPGDSGSESLARNVYASDTNTAADWSLTAFTSGSFCSSGQTVCGGTCVLLSADPQHCGRCGNVCSAAGACVNSKCTYGDAVNVAIIEASSEGPALRSALLATGAFVNVDVINADTSTPSVAMLQQYDAVLVYSDSTFLSPINLGDNLADYFDAGGQVVVATFANASVPLAGRFVTGGYFTFQGTGQKNISTALGTLSEPSSPLLRGVGSLGNAVNQTIYMASSVSLSSGAVVVAFWSTGEPMVVRRHVNGRPRVDLNLFPRTTDFSGDLAPLVRNALQYR